MLLCIIFRNITRDTNLIVVPFPEELKTNKPIIEHFIIHSHTLKCVFRARLRMDCSWLSLGEICLVNTILTISLEDNGRDDSINVILNPSL